MSNDSVIIDSFDTTPEFAPLRSAVAAGSWSQLESSLERMDSALQSAAISQLGDVAGVEVFLENWLRNSPTSPMAQTALAVRFIKIAWEIRSGAQAEDVSREQFEGFWGWLREADAMLVDVQSRHPEFAPAWAASIISARGLQLELDEVTRRYRRAVALDPNDFQSHGQMHQFVLPKWFGSWPEAETFVRDVSKASIRGSNSSALIAQFHIERWAEVSGTKNSTAVMKEKGVLEDLRAAAERSVLHGTAPLDTLRVEAHTMFVMAYWLGDYYEDAAVHLRALDGRFTAFPWYYITEDQERLAAIRAAILAPKKKRWFGR